MRIFSFTAYAHACMYACVCVYACVACRSEIKILNLTE